METFSEYVKRNLNEKFSSKKNEKEWKKALAVPHKKRTAVSKTFNDDFRMKAKLLRTAIKEDDFISKWIEDTDYRLERSDLEDMAEANVEIFYEENKDKNFDKIVDAFRKFLTKEGKKMMEAKKKLEDKEK